MGNIENRNARQAVGFMRRHGGGGIVDVRDRSEDPGNAPGNLTSPGTFTHPDPKDIRQTLIDASSSSSGGSAVSEAMAIGRKAVRELLDALTKAPAAEQEVKDIYKELKPGYFQKVASYDSSTSNVVRKTDSQSQLKAEVRKVLEEIFHPTLSKADWEAAAAGDLAANQKVAAATDSKWAATKGLSGVRLSTGQPLQKTQSDMSPTARWARRFGGAA